jgi:hypothetical protein
MPTDTTIYPGMVDRVMHDTRPGAKGSVHRDARFSRCRLYRYALWRRWSDGPQVLFVMLNPSTADETHDDPTVRRCIGFAQAWGFGAIAVGNLFALCTSSPSALQAAKLPIGNMTDRWLARLQAESSVVVAAWGNHGTFCGRSTVVRAWLREPHVLGVTRRGEPRHPLYARCDAQLVAWTAVCS